MCIRDSDPALHAKARQLDASGARILFAPVEALPMASSVLRARLGGDECPPAGRTRKSGLYSGGFIWYTGAADRKTGPGTPGDAPAPE